MINPSIPQPDWPYYKSEYDAGRMTQGAIAKALHITQGAVSRRFKAMADASPSGSPESAPGLPSVHFGSPDIARQSDVDALNTRVEVLEAFIATLQQQQTPIPGSPNGSPVVHPVHSGSPSGSPTHKRGFVLADDLWDAIHTYAEAHHAQIAQVVDVALRTFFAAVAEEVAADE